MDDVKMGMSVSLARSALNIQANMSAALISGTIDKGAEKKRLQQYLHGLGMKRIKKARPVK